MNGVSYIVSGILLAVTASSLPLIDPEASLVGIGLRPDGQVTFCLTDGPRCYAVNLVTGEYTPAPTPPAGDDGIPYLLDQPPETPVRVSDAGISTCASCPPFKPLGFSKDDFDRSTLSIEGDRAVVVVKRNGIPYAEVFKPSTGKRLSLIKLSRDDSCGYARLLDGVVYGTYSYCAGPSDTGSLYDARTGRRIAPIAGVKDFTAFGTMPARVSADLWAFNSGDGLFVAIQNVKTGVVRKRIDLTPLFTKKEYGYDRYPGANVMLMLKDRLVVIYEMPMAGTIAVIDPAKGRIEKIIVPARPAPKP